MRGLTWLSDALQAQRGHLFPWVPVLYGMGIGAYFAAGSEPGPVFWAALGAAGALSALLALTVARQSILLLALMAMIAGFGVAGLRTATVDAPVLGFRYYGPIEGRVVGIDRSQSDKTRLTLDRVVLRDVAPDRTPARVRVSLHGEQGFTVPEPGLTVILTGHLSAPEGPVEPGGFDFQRMAFFDGLGAVGYTRTPVLVLRPAAEGRAGLAVYRARMAITAEVIEGVGGQAGGFAAAITTGHRADIDAPTLDALRASSLQHILSISGLHMVLVTGFVFAAVRGGLALIPPLALRWPLKKIAALAALASGAAYLALSGADVPAERAFVQVAVVLAAVLLDRRALTLRAVALAALIVLSWRPEALTEPGFQMSFAATVALVAAFGALREAERTRVPRWLRPAAATLLSSAVAGAATGPFAAAHFNQIPHYGMLANMLAVPVMGVVIMPAAVLAAVLAPVGLHGIGLAIMRPGIEWILWVARWVAALPGALSFAASPPAFVVPMLALGGLWVVLWQGRARALGVLPVVAGFVFWAGGERPAVLISPSGALVGVEGPEGRALSKPRGDGFAAQSWLENDGDPVDQIAAAARPGFRDEDGMLRFGSGALAGVVLTGRGASERLPAACATGDLVIYGGEAAPPQGCRIVDALRLGEQGAIALYDAPGGPRIVTVRDSVGRRPWNTQ